MGRNLILMLAAMTALTSCVRATHAVVAQDVPARVASPHALLDALALNDPLHAAADVTPEIVRDLTHAAPAFDLGTAGGDDARRAEDCLTAAVYYEARSEPIDGQRAVAQVVLNRVRDRAFPASVCGTVYQRSSKGCQFSFACDGSMAHPLEPRSWMTARAVAQAALGGSVYAPVGAATYYHANYVMPWWAPSLTRIGQIGSHIFYRWRDTMGAALTFRQNYSGVEGDAPQPMADAGLAPAPGAADWSRIAQEGGVTVHRGAVEAAATDAASPAGAPAASSTDRAIVPAAPRGPRTVAGVHIHQGLAPVSDASVGEEETPGG